jgi:NADPH-dependent 2,4-dienoyl-CoA reductase/sulfur reductase-like enzyme
MRGGGVGAAPERVPRRVVIAGASAAGLAVAETLRRENFRGTITLIGDEPHLPYDRPPLSKQILAGTWTADRLPLRPPADLDALGLDLRLGVAAAGLDPVSRTVLLSDGDGVPYDALVIAIGVRPRRLPGGGHVLRTLDDALALRKKLGPGRRLVVVGAGFLGAEVAATARALGAAVTLLETAPVPLAAVVGSRIGETLAQVHRDNGVDLRTGVMTTGIAPDGVQLSDGTRIEADDVLVAIGSVPNTEWLGGSGLTVDGELLCDEYSAVAPGIYAAGDVARSYNPLFGVTARIEHRTNASEQGMAVARNLLRPHAPRPFTPVPYFWSDQYGLRIQAHGYLRDHDEVTLLESGLPRPTLLTAYRTADRLTGVLAVNLPARRLLPWRRALSTPTPWTEVVQAAPAL